MELNQILTQLNVVLLSTFEKPTAESRAAALIKVKASFAAAKTDYTWEDQIQELDKAWTKTKLNPDRSVLVLFLMDSLPVDAEEADAVLTEMPSAPEWTEEALACMGQHEAMFAYIQGKAREMVDKVIKTKIAPSTDTVQ